MNTFCTGKDLAAQRTRVRRRTVLFLGLCLLALLLFVTLCLITRTDNAAGTLRIAIISMILLGCACITVWVCLLSPAASSYDMFKNFEVRGDEFQKLVRQN